MHRLIGSRVYLDANIFILFAEGSTASGPALHAHFDGLNRRVISFTTSELTLAEVLVRPIQLRNEEMIAAYEAILQIRPSFEPCPVDLATLRLCARLRAEQGHKLPDAIHIASALSANCRFFISEDRRLRSFDQLQVLRLADLVTAAPPSPHSETP